MTRQSEYNAVNAFHAKLVQIGVPLVGVCPEDWDNDATWRVDFEGARAPTPAELGKIQGAKVGFNPHSY